MFYPSVSVNARYTVSEGGRVIDFPVGDLMNPVYSTLNQLTASNMFPQVENQEIRFLRPTEHETKLRLVQPVFNTDLYYNAKIKKELTSTEGIGVEQYRRELVAEIRKAYYNVGMMESLLQMLQETRLLLQENVRVNERLLANDKITRDNLLRSQTEQSKFDQQLQEAMKNRQVASAYFNFLLNRPLTDSIVIEPPLMTPMPAGLQEDYSRQAVLSREEIRSLEQYGHISDLNIRLNKAAVAQPVYSGRLRISGRKISFQQGPGLYPGFFGLELGHIHRITEQIQDPAGSGGERNNRIPAEGGEKPG
jgi:hypothetical protein